MKNGADLLFANEDLLRTTMGAWFPGERVVFRGKDLHTDLSDMSWFGLYVYGITGRKFTESQLNVLNSLWSYTSYPDPRLWNNRVAALAGTTRSTGALGIGAAIAVSEASIYGRRPDIRAIDFLYRAKARVDRGEELITIIKQELKKYRTIYGYGRPIVKEDERNVHIKTLLENNNLDNGDYYSLAIRVENILQEGRWRFRMNFGGLAAATCADLGFSPKEYYLYALPGFLAGMLPCFIEANEKPAGTFLPLGCNRINYTGKNERHWD